MLRTNFRQRPHSGDVAVLESLEARMLLGADLPHRLYMPEGFAGEGIAEFVPLFNPNEDAADFQVWAHFETGERDMMLTSGTIEPGIRGGFTLSDWRFPQFDLVERDRPYAIEIRSDQALIANISRYDRGATGEAFTSVTSTTWVVPSTFAVEGMFNDFLVWYNPGEDDASITISIFNVVSDEDPRPDASFTMTRMTEAGRRDGLALGQLDLPELVFGPVSIEIVSDVPIVAATSDYGPDGAFLALGVPGAPETFGVLPDVRHDSNGTLVATDLVFFNPSETEAATIGLTLHVPDEDDRMFSAAVVVPPRSARSVLVELLLDADEDFVRGSFEYTASTGVYAAILSGFSAPGTGNSVHRDLLGSPVAAAATRLFIAEGFMLTSRAGDTIFETLAIHNDADPDPDDNEVTVRFLFSNGTTLDLDPLQLADGDTVLIDLHELDELLAIADVPTGVFYSIEIVGASPITASLHHDDRVMTLPFLIGFEPNRATPWGGFLVNAVPIGQLPSDPSDPSDPNPPIE